MTAPALPAALPEAVVEFKCGPTTEPTDDLIDALAELLLHLEDQATGATEADE